MGGAQLDTNTDTYEITTYQQDWAGFYCKDVPAGGWHFPYESTLEFRAMAPSGDTNPDITGITFMFQKLPHPDNNDPNATEPSFSKHVSFEGQSLSDDEPQKYVVTIPSQGLKTFSSLVLYIEGDTSTSSIKV